MIWWINSPRWKIPTDRWRLFSIYGHAIAHTFSLQERAEGTVRWFVFGKRVDYGVDLLLY